MPVEQLSGAWGRHVGDVTRADSWARESIRRLADYEARTDYAAKRGALLSAWQAIAYAYRAANVPPSSDPTFRAVIAAYYGDCHTLEEYMRSYTVGPLVSVDGGGIVGRAVSSIWNTLKGRATCAQITAVRISLSSEANVVTTCLDAPDGSGDCDYRGLFTGHASATADGVYREHGLDTRDVTTFDWYDPPGSPSECAITRCSPPLLFSAAVLHVIQDSWASRGGAAGVIPSVVTFVNATNLLNANAAGMLPDEYLVASRAIVLEAAQESTGMTPARATIAAVAGAVAAACANVPGYGWLCSLAAAAVGAAATLIPVAVGVAVDGLGVPMANSRARTAWLPSSIRTPAPDGSLPFVVPAAPSESTTARYTLGTTDGTPTSGAAGAATGGSTGPVGNTLANANRNTRPVLELLGPDGRPLNNATGSGPSTPLILAGVALMAFGFWGMGGARKRAERRAAWDKVLF